MDRLIKYVILIILLASCGHIIHEGEIIEKYYEPSRYYNYTTITMVGKTTIPQINTIYDDEDFIIVVRGINGKDTITEKFYIDKSNWQCLNVGDIFKDSIPCKTDDDGIK